MIELKRGDKYESNALAEVLHHAWKLQTGGGATAGTAKYPLPVMVTSYHSWLRAALSYLFDHGLQRNALRFLEATYLSGPNGRYLWLMEPLADWIPTLEVPDVVPRSWIENGVKWYRVQGSAAWIGTDKETLDKMPLLPETGCACGTCPR